MTRLNINASNRLKLNAIRILFLGDPGVGKTSLIYCLANDEHKSGLPAKIADQTIPTEDTPEKVSVLLIDYNSRLQDELKLKDSLYHADVICLVYSLKDERNFKRALSHWIPLIREYQTNYSETTYKPVILVANKADYYDGKDDLGGVMTELRKIVEIQDYIEVSAKKRLNVKEMLSKAQGAVMYPAAPLIDVKGKMTHEFIMALKQIFSICDLDGDGFLNKHEMDLFQENCFGAFPQMDVVDYLKSSIEESDEYMMQGDNIAIIGFLYMHRLCLDRSREDFVWKVLRKFNYDVGNNGRLVKFESIYDPKRISDLDLKKYADKSVQTQETQAIDVDHTSTEDAIANGVEATGLAVKLESIDGCEDNSDQNSTENIDSNKLQQGLETQAKGVDDETAKKENTIDSDASWIRMHSKLVSAGFGLTLATIIGIVALRYLI